MHRKRSKSRRLSLLLPHACVHFTDSQALPAIKPRYLLNHPAELLHTLQILGAGLDEQLVESEISLLPEENGSSAIAGKPGIAGRIDHLPDAQHLGDAPGLGDAAIGAVRGVALEDFGDASEAGVE
jgi:hypothetical protein